MQLSVLPDFALQQGAADLKALRGKTRSPAQQRKQLKAAAKEFEAMMLDIMIKTMRQNVPASPLFGKSNAEQIYTDMLDSQYARSMADNSSMGMARMLVSQLGPDLPGDGKLHKGAGPHPLKPGVASDLQALPKGPQAARAQRTVPAGYAQLFKP